MTDTLILLRHGQSQANADGLFTGLLDVPLTDAGRAEAEGAAQQLDSAGLWPPIWFCSPLLRAKQTALILNDCLSTAPTRISYDWRLAERNYGALTGHSKQAVLAEHGAENYRAWRRSKDVAPPPMPLDQRRDLGDVPESLGLTESLADVIVRVDDVWRASIEPALRQRGAVLVVAHGNSLRALCAILDQLNDVEIQDLNIPTGHPLVYRIDPDSRPLQRGGSYLNRAAAIAAAETIAHEGGT